MIYLLSALLLGSVGASDQCTTIAVDRAAMVDGSAVATHNDDCNECDIRVSHVPARDWPKDSDRPVFATRPPYPRYLEEEEYNIHGPDYRVGTEDSSVFEWKPMKPVFHIPQVRHTFGYTLGNYPLQNEKQLSMGESTCASRFFTKSAYVASDPGKARVDMNTMMEVAMERCETARCAIQTMGNLATELGFYGSDPGAEGGGEAVTIADGVSETWVFHVLADDTGTSAIWAAQRVPDGHITVVPNQFIITEMDLKDKDYYMASENIHEVAKRNNLWDPAGSTPFNFLKVYGWDYGKGAFGCTRRTWRVFTLAAPSLEISPFTDGFTTFGYGDGYSQPYPFSVKPDKQLTLEDIMAMTRDTYEGSLFDLGKGLAAGPFGDVMRYEAMPTWMDAEQGVIYPDETADANGFERAISLYRTVYASIAQARSDLPDEVGGVVWIAPNAPHHSSFVPVYASPDKTPSSINRGNQHVLDKKANYWAHSVTANYVSRWYQYTIKDVRALQTRIQQAIVSRQHDVEKKAVELIWGKKSKKDKHRVLESAEGAAASAEDQASNVQRAVEMLQTFHTDTAASVRDQWWDFFWAMTSKYRDQMIIVNPHVEEFPKACAWMMYPRWWLESIGFWGAPFTPAPKHDAPSPVLPNGYPTLQSQQEYGNVYPDGAGTPYTNKCLESSNLPFGAGVGAYVAVLMSFLAGAACTYYVHRCSGKDKRGYSEIPESNAL